MVNISFTPNVAIVCAAGLGDSVIQMVLANSIAANGFSVSLYSDYAHELSKYQSEVALRPFPAASDLILELKDSQIILFDCRSSYVRRLTHDAQTWLERNGIAYQVCKGKFRAKNKHRAALEQRIACREFSELFLDLNTRLRTSRRNFIRSAVADDIARFLVERTDFDVVEATPGLRLPDIGRSSKLIAIHPTSSREGKNWSEHKYVSLAKRLKGAGFKPVITVSAGERYHWKSLIGDIAPVPNFETVEKLYEFYASVACFVGNDSGGAHLAAAAGAPTVQMFSRWRKKPGWRAAWSDNKVLVARFPFSLQRNKWQQGISVNRVFDAVLDTLSKQQSRPESLSFDSLSHGVRAVEKVS